MSLPLRFYVFFALLDTFSQTTEGAIFKFNALNWRILVRYYHSSRIRVR